jgi:hypothetical protein
MLFTMKVFSPGWYAVLLPNDTFAMELTALQTEIYRELGAVQARLLPPCGPLFVLNDTSFFGEMPPRAEKGRAFGSFLKKRLAAGLVFKKAETEGSYLYLPPESKNVNLDPGEIETFGFRGIEIPEYAGSMLITAGLEEKLIRPALELAHRKFPGGKVEKSPAYALLQIEAFSLRGEETGSAWKLFPL